ncbi:MAG: hypothetical protein FJX55_03560 [Alphaproteobacteria bacterium]|nr:hypothetical protein [Alphaproteobacteria bacterium]
MTGPAEAPAIADAGTEKPPTWADAVATATAELAGQAVPAEAPAAEAPKSEPVEQATEPEEKPVGADKTTIAATAPDIWANATPEQKAAIAALEGNATRYRNMVVPLQRRLSDLEHKAKSAPAAEAPKPAADPAKAERLKKAREEFPDVVEPITDALEEVRAEAKSATARLKSLDQERLDARIAATNEFIYSTHPDFDQVGQSDAFAKWAETHKDPLVRGAYERNKGALANVVEAVAVVTKFKQESAAPSPAPAPAAGQPEKSPAPVDPKRTRQLATAAAPRTTTPALPSQAKPTPGTPEHWRWAVQQAQKEMASGV